MFSRKLAEMTAPLYGQFAHLEERQAVVRQLFDQSKIFIDQTIQSLAQLAFSAGNESGEPSLKRQRVSESSSSTPEGAMTRLLKRHNQASEYYNFVREHLQQIAPHSGLITILNNEMDQHTLAAINLRSQVSISPEEHLAVDFGETLYFLSKDDLVSELKLLLKVFQNNVEPSPNALVDNCKTVEVLAQVLDLAATLVDNGSPRDHQADNITKSILKFFDEFIFSGELLVDIEKINWEGLGIYLDYICQKNPEAEIHLNLKPSEDNLDQINEQVKKLVAFVKAYPEVSVEVTISGLECTRHLQGLADCHSVNFIVTGEDENKAAQMVELFFDSLELDELRNFFSQKEDSPVIYHPVLRKLAIELEKDSRLTGIQLPTEGLASLTNFKNLKTLLINLVGDFASVKVHPLLQVEDASILAKPGVDLSFYRQTLPNVKQLTVLVKPQDNGLEIQDDQLNELLKLSHLEKLKIERSERNSNYLPLRLAGLDLPKNSSLTFEVCEAEIDENAELILDAEDFIKYYKQSTVLLSGITNLEAIRAFKDGINSENFRDRGNVLSEELKEDETITLTFKNNRIVPERFTAG